MKFKYITTLPRSMADESLVEGIKALRIDYRSALDSGNFVNWIGREITFEEFMMALCLELEMQAKLGPRHG